MGKSLKNVVSPDEMYAAYGADTFRLYEMFMGPLEPSRPWDTRPSSAATASCSGCGATSSTRRPARSSSPTTPTDDATTRVLHRTIAAVRADFAELRFNTAIARLIELNNPLTKLDGGVPREVAEPLVLMVAPLAPHIAEELWADRGRLAGPLGRARHVPRPQPVGPVGRPGGRRRLPRRAPPRPRHVPVPERRRAARRPPAGLHRHRRRRALQPDARQERAALPGLRRVRAAGRAVRGADRPAPAQDHRGQHRHHGAPAAPPGPGPRRPPRDPDHRPRVLPLDPVDLPADLQLLVRRRCRAPRRRAGPRPADRRARRGVPLRRPPAARRRRPRLGRPQRRRARRHPRRPAPGLHQRGAGQLVPRPGHGAVQRGGHQRRPLRARQLPGVQAQPAPVDDAHHRLRRPAGRRPRPGRLAREGPDHAAELDRPQLRRQGHLPDRAYLQ